MPQPATIQATFLPEDTLVVELLGKEELSRPYELDVSFLVAAREWDSGTSVAMDSRVVVTLESANADEPPSVFAGVFSQLELVRQHGEQVLVRGTLVPRLWRLGLSVHSRVFTNCSVRDVIRDVLNDSELSGTYEFRLTHNYEAEEHICQYRESDLAFLSRWMEREGIFYYFRHERGGERLIISDDMLYERNAIPHAVPYLPVPRAGETRFARLDAFACRRRSIPGRIVVKDYDPLAPNRQLIADQISQYASEAVVHLHAEGFLAREAGRRLARIRTEEQLAGREIFEGAGTRMHIRPGHTIEVEKHPHEAFNRKYLVREVRHKYETPVEVPPGLLDNASRPLDPYYAWFTAIKDDVQYRPPCATRWPSVAGYELAIVYGPAESEYAQIDDHGRYLVKFLFDERAEDGRPGSTRLRMMQPHGGSVEGFHFPLRKGTEVVVSFLGGDPDNPLITGVVPNASCPSVVTAKNAKLNVIQTGSLNRVQLDDQKGAEHVRISTPTASTFLHLGGHAGAGRSGDASAAEVSALWEPPAERSPSNSAPNEAGSPAAGPSFADSAFSSLSRSDKSAQTDAPNRAPAARAVAKPTGQPSARAAGDQLAVPSNMLWDGIASSPDDDKFPEWPDVRTPPPTSSEVALHTKGNGQEVFGRNLFIGVEGHFVESIKGRRFELHTSGHEEHVQKYGHLLSVMGGGQRAYITGDQKIRVRGVQDTEIWGEQMLTVHGGQIIWVDGNRDDHVEGSVLVTTPQDYTIRANKGFIAVAPKKTLLESTVEEFSSLRKDFYLVKKAILTLKSEVVGMATLGTSYKFDLIKSKFERDHYEDKKIAISRSDVKVENDKFGTFLARANKYVIW